jgi:hypothetical protein
VYDIGFLNGALASCAMVVFVLFRLRQVRWRDRGRWALAGGFLFSTIGQLAEISTVARYVDALSGVPNLYRLVAYVCAALIGMCTAVLMAHWTSPEQTARKLRRRLAFFAACIVGHLVTFSIGNDPAVPRRFTVDDVQSPSVATFLLVHVAVQICYLADIAVITWRFARLAPRTWMRSGLRLATIGAAVGILQAVSKALYVAAGLAGGHPEGGEEVGAIMVMTASVLLVMGWTTPALEPHVVTAWNWLVRYRGHRQLYPLWRALFDAVPAIALEPPTGRWQATWSPHDLKLRVLRRVIEIRDGRLNVAPYIDPGVADTAHRMGTRAGLSGADLDAVVEAARIRTGLAALRRAETAPAAHEMPAVAGFNEITSEIDWLSRVARAFTSSPIARAAADAHQGRHP